MARKAWAVYAALLTAAVVIGEAENLRHGVPFDFRAFGGWFVTGVLLTGTWGYALDRAIGRREYWRVASWLVPFAIVVTAVPAAIAGVAARLAVGLLLVVVVPACVASFLYAYRSPQLWIGREDPDLDAWRSGPPGDR
jgi:hypothetical protein